RPRPSTTPPSPYTTLFRSQRHYDLSGELYKLFLDKDMQYSCAYFESPDATLEEAQLAKKRHLAAKLRLEPGQNVLDIGSGWGGRSEEHTSELQSRENLVCR